MHTQSIQSLVNHAQANNVLNTTAAADIRQLVRDVESSVIDGVILIDAVFEELDRIGAVPPQLHSAIARINCFAMCAKRHLVLIGESTEQVIAMTQAVQQ